MSQGSTFDPSKYLTQVGAGNKKADYLDVKWRLVWLRSVDRDAVIETVLIRADEREAIFRARVELTSGGMATGYGTETAADFKDYIEKAETKALGRALAALGFGAQFATGLDGLVVDSPVRPLEPVPSSVVPIGEAPSVRGGRVGAAQLRAIGRLAVGLKAADFLAPFGVTDVSDLNTNQAADLIRTLQAKARA